MSPRLLHVSDHALLRILERAGGVDIEGLRRTVALSVGRAAAAAAAIEQNEYKIVAGGLVYIVANQCVVTVHPEAKR
ncbi:hypothetical protein IP86_10905 [Rhodopseudomonas sp. AAP120]|uniref:hypothetical protein n=1 Tax=Rhodopseudomonas sp. AAP120 TaxID=1523430 RepID=UPI0006B89690|nr:hypothetical protein [Rhodopseudomonas sp. AAP120]KPF98825.1 hypothetical protein IP86_10905 [Rhodopseudomonas sp. AAP120]